MKFLKKGRMLNLSIWRHLDLFDKNIQPTLLYGCEVLGFSNIVVIERLYLQFCKILLHL